MTGVITGSTGDGQVNSGSTVSATTATYGRVGADSGVRHSVIHVFQIPSSIVTDPSQQFSSATYGTKTAVGSTMTLNIDLYGVGLSHVTQPTLLGADFYEGALDTSNTLIQNNFIVPTTPAYSSVSNSSAALVNYLNGVLASARASGATTAYAFLRNSLDAYTWSGVYILGMNEAGGAYAPTLAYATTTTSSVAVLPWPWTETSVGTAVDQGVALFDGSYVLANLGAEIWLLSDKFKFVTQSLTGDGTLTVKISSIASSDVLSRAGLMIRENMDANAKNVLLALTTNSGLVFQSRQVASENTAFRATSVSKTAPVWLKLARSGDVFTASYSSDGTTWTVQGTDTITMGSTVQVGLAYSNRSSTTWAFGAGDQLKLVTPTDTDGNGLTDAWEMQHFGHLGVSPLADPDVDGFTNAQECALATNPVERLPVLAVVSGNNQSGATGSVLPQPLIVKVTDANTGAPLAGLPVSFQPSTGQGLVGSETTWLPTVVAVSDVNGLVQTNYQFSNLGGVMTVQAVVGNQASVATFTLKSLLGVAGSTFLFDNSNVGTSTVAGQNQYQAGVYTLSAANGDITGTADSFNYAWQTFSGDGLIVARVASLSATNAAAKAGVMMRESLNANSRNVMVAVIGSTAVFEWRDTNGVAASSTTLAGSTAPKWIALRRSGSKISGYCSLDGHTWNLLGARNFVSANPVYAGLTLNTQSTAIGQAAFDSVSVTTPLAPSPWQLADIGSINAGSIDEFTSSTVLMRAGGGDVWNTSDSFRYVYQPLVADGDMVVRIVSQTNSAGWAKSGIMLRESTAADSRNVFFALTPANGVALQSRLQNGATSTQTLTVPGTAPTWLKLERLWSTVNAYQSADGLTWTKVGSVNWGVGSALIGLASSSNNTAASVATLFDNISVSSYANPLGWSAAYFSSKDLTSSPYLRRDATIDFSWLAGQSPAPGVSTGNYSVRWQGFVQPQTTDTYTFTVLSSGGVRLRVNGLLVIDRWSLQTSATEVSGQAALQSGVPAQVSLEYFNGTEAARIQLRWSNPTQSDALVSTTSVQPVDTDNDGLPNAWETVNNLNPLSAADALLTADGDGLTNLAKYQLGLTPGQHADRVLGGVMMEEWRSLSGTNITDLTNSTRFCGTPDSRTLLTSLETVATHGDNYGERIRGYIVAPTDGLYQFWIAADDRAELWLSPTDSPFERTKIAWNINANSFRSYFDASSQRSALIPLQAGHYYYFEVLQKEGTLSDNLSVAWTPPGGTRAAIGAAYLATFAPRADNLVGDGLPDAWKTANGLDATKGYGVNGAYADPDVDGLTNLAEYQAHTNPLVADTDGDGFSDKVEWQAGFDPIDSAKHPLGTSPWIYANIGTVDANGVAADTLQGGYLLIGNGVGIVGANDVNPSSNDAFRFLYQAVSGDFDLKSKVANVGGGFGTAALVVRDGFNTKATSASLCVDETGAFAFQVRPDSVSETIIMRKNVAPALHWLRLQRKGQVINSYYSVDGQYWTLFSSAVVNLPATCELGMAAWCSTVPTSQVFSNLTFLSGTAASDPAGESQVNNLDPLLPNISGTTIVSYAGNAGTATLGSWRTVGTSVVSQTVKATLDFEIQLPADGAYLLELEAKSGGNNTLNVGFPVRVSIDGQFIDLVSLLLPAGQVSLAHVGTPWLKAGTHHVSFVYDNTQSYRYLQINALRVQTLGGADTDANGIPDWEDTRLSTLNTFKPLPTASYASPVCVEGTSRFLSMMTLEADGQLISPKVGPGFVWYADVPLSQDEPVFVDASFENGVIGQSVQFTWKPLNLLADNTTAFPSGIMRIRKGDSLLLTASPESSSGGSAVVTLSRSGVVDVQITVASPQSTPVAHLFDQAGTYTVTGVYTDGTGSTVSGSLTIEVVQAQLNGNPSLGVGAVLRWDNPLIPAGVSLETDQGVSLQLVGPLPGGGQQLNLTTQHPGTGYILARLYDGGPILAQTTVFGITVASDDRTANDHLVTYPDGSKLIGTPIIINGLTPNMTVVVQVLAPGVTFDDGTVVKTFTTADFDQYGRIYVKFIYPSGIFWSYCHFIRLYDGTTYLGEF